MSALHIKLSVYIDTADTPPAIVVVARSPKRKQIAANGLMGDTTTINMVVHPGVVLEVHIHHVDAAATLVADEAEAKDTAGNGEAMRNSSSHQIDGIPRENKGNHNSQTESAKSMVGNESVTFVDFETNMLEDHNTFRSAREYAATNGRTCSLGSARWETTMHEVMAADTWAITEIITGVGLPVTGEGYDPVLPGLLTETDKAYVVDWDNAELVEEIQFVDGKLEWNS